MDNLVLHTTLNGTKFGSSSNKVLRSRLQLILNHSDPRVRRAHGHSRASRPRNSAEWAAVHQVVDHTQPYPQGVPLSLGKTNQLINITSLIVGIVRRVLPLVQFHRPGCETVSVVTSWSQIRSLSTLCELGYTISLPLFVAVKPPPKQAPKHNPGTY